MKLSLEDLNHDPYLSHSINTYTYEAGFKSFKFPKVLYQINFLKS